MRKIVALLLAVAILSVSTPAMLVAQGLTSPVLSSITGQTVDAAGRAVAGQRVELVQNGVVTQTTTTNSKGEYTFAKVGEGTYVVRVVINGIPAGIRVPVAAGTAVKGATIVLPSAAAPSGFAGIPIFVLLIGSAVLVTTIAVVANELLGDES